MVGKREVNSRAYAASFNFKGPDQQKRVKDLSGGERNRLHLAKLLKSGATCCSSTSPPRPGRGQRSRPEEALLAFAGCAVSSPRPLFLDRIATHMLPSRREPGVWYRGTTRTTRRTGTAGWARPIGRTASSTQADTLRKP